MLFRFRCWLCALCWKVLTVVGLAVHCEQSVLRCCFEKRDVSTMVASWWCAVDLCCFRLRDAQRQQVLVLVERTLWLKRVLPTKRTWRKLCLPDTMKPSEGCDDLDSEMSWTSLHCQPVFCSYLGLFLFRGWGCFWSFMFLCLRAIAFCLHYPCFWSVGGITIKIVYV